MDWHHHRYRPNNRPGSRWISNVAEDELDYVHPILAWELQARGYNLSDAPVNLEPPFVPYVEFARNGSVYPFDDFNYRSQLDQCSAQPQGSLDLRLPIQQRVNPNSVDQFIRSISGLSHPVSFEIFGDASTIVYQLCAAQVELDALAAQVHAHFPLSVARSCSDLLLTKLKPFQGIEIGYMVVDFGLEFPAYQPLKLFTQFSIDPIAGVVGALSNLSSGELAGIQVLFTPCRNPWRESFDVVSSELSAMKDIPDGKRKANLTAHKLGGSLYACAIRVFAVATNGDEAAFELCRQISGALGTLSEPGSNSLLPLSNDDYLDEDHFKDLLERRTRRFGMILSSSELLGLFHPPCESITTHKLQRTARREVPLPPSVAGQAGVKLGLHRFQGKDKDVSWPDALRTRHAYILGATRVGKSTLLLNLIAQDLKRRGGLCVIDPHGDLAKDVLSIIPKNRMNDVLYLNFADRDFPPALNLLEPVPGDEQGLLCSDLLSILRRLFAASWGDRLEHILRYCLLTLLNSPGHTVRDIRKLLLDSEFRSRTTRNLPSPDIQAFWDYEFPTYNPTVFAPIHNKLGLLLANPILRNVIAQPQSRLDFGKAMAEKKVLIVNLSQGELGEDVASFLGAMLVSRIQIAGMRSLRLDKTARIPFTLYVDEFQNFLVSSFEKILSEAGKVNLSIVMANQFLGQLSPSMLQAILGNIGALVAFRIGIDDAKKLEKDFGGRFTQEDLLSQTRGEAIVKMGSAQESFNLMTLPPPFVRSSNKIETIILSTREAVCRSRAEIEADLRGGSAHSSSVSHSTNDPISRTKGAASQPPNASDEPEFFALPDHDDRDKR